MSQLKLFMVLLGSKPPGRHIEQHDVFFGIAPSINGLKEEIINFWPETAGKMHIDAWREVSFVEGYNISITLKTGNILSPEENKNKLFFINLGGYQERKFEEQHYFLLTIKDDKNTALKEAKETFFFKHNHFTGAIAHVDDKYGIDVDDMYLIDDILSPRQKEMYQIQITPALNGLEDEFHLGYLKLAQLEG